MRHIKTTLLIFIFVGLLFLTNKVLKEEVKINQIAATGVTVKNKISLLIAGK